MWNFAGGFRWRAVLCPTMRRHEDERKVLPGFVASLDGAVDIPYITKTQKEFYGYYLSERYNQILMPAFQRLVSLEKMKRKHQNKQTMEYQEEEELERLKQVCPNRTRLGD